MQTEPNEMRADVLTQQGAGWVDSAGISRNPGDYAAIVLPGWFGRGGRFVGRGSTGQLGEIRVHVTDGVCSVSVGEAIQTDDDFTSKMALGIVLVLIVLVFGLMIVGESMAQQHIQREQQDAEAAGEGVYKRTPMPYARREPGGPAQEAAKSEPARNAGHEGSAPVGPRPLVRVYSQPERCPACAQFEKWLKRDGVDSPLKFQPTREVPDWVESVPAFHFRDRRGVWRVRYGWKNEQTERAIRRDIGVE